MTTPVPIDAKPSPAASRDANLALVHTLPDAAAGVDAGIDEVSIGDAIEYACALVPPLWTLRNFVAVNPFIGLVEKPYAEAIVDIHRIQHADPLWKLARYRALYDAGRIGDPDLEEAVGQAPAALGRPDLADVAADSIRRMMFGEGSRAARVHTFAERLDLVSGGAWNEMIVGEIAGWCAGRFDVGQSSWTQPHADRPLYQAWRAIAQLDRSPEIRGLAGFRRFVRSLPEDPDECIRQMVGELGVPAEDLRAVLARALASVSGWAGHIQYLIRQAAMGGDPFEDRLSDLLAIRLAFDGALHRIKANEPGLASWADAHPAAGPADDEPGDAQLFSDLEIRHLWQLALEAGYRRELLDRVTAPKEPGPELAKPAVMLQAAFCIDVRSELLRRHLEGATDRVQTIGFAGFFGLPIETVRDHEDRGQARCPALLSPAYRVADRRDRSAQHVEARIRNERFHSIFKKLRLSSVAAFPFVETIGQAFGLRLVTDSLGWSRPGADSRLFQDPKFGEFVPDLDDDRAEGNAHGVELEQRIELAESILLNTGLTKQIAPYVLFCGHGSSTTNNPYASALDCGACGGYAGDINARTAAALLNDPAVRAALPERGFAVPSETRFLAGLHDTTTDEIRLFDTEGICGEELGAIRSWLERAAAATRQERARGLGLEPGAAPDRRIRKRSRDWSELRPEWGLAGNAGFIAAPRDRTRGLDLGGRCFLHDYHADRDPDGRVLELILTAPLVVASWINLQYYASTVDNETFGSGSKTIHNVVGRHGVVSGNGGDLRVGLPFQSVHDGERPVHEPLRLTALVEAPTGSISEILSRQDSLRELIENRWIDLISIDTEGGGVFRWKPSGFERIGNERREQGQAG